MDKWAKNNKNQRYFCGYLAQNSTMFSTTLRQLMKEKKLNQLQLAEILQIRQSQISNWLNGKSLPGYYSLKLICEKLGVTAEQLLQ